MLSAALGAIFRRWFGGGFFSAPRIVRVAAGIALGYCVAFVMQSTDGPLALWAWPTAAALIAGWGWVPGHGSYMDMGRMPIVDNEFLKPLLDRIFGPDDEVASLWRDFAGMALRYLIVTVPLGAAAVLLTGSPMGWAIMPGGLLVAVGYLLAWEVLDGSRVSPTAVGEYCAGAIIYGSIALV